jgi:hypothetical protein
MEARDAEPGSEYLAELNRFEGQKVDRVEFVIRQS